MEQPEPNGKYDLARRFYESLMRSQWLTAGKIIAYQETQLQQMLAHAAAYVPFYREPLAKIRLADGQFDLQRWGELPITNKEIVAADWDAFQATELPAGHQGVLQMTTSGSEGRSFPVRKTRFDHTGVACASFRYADWFGYDFGTPLALIRAGFIRPTDETDIEDKLWGPPWIDPALRGARHRLHIGTPVEQQLEWLASLGKVYLNTLPSNAMALAQLAEERGLKLQIAALLTVGEKLTTDIRDEIRRIWGCRTSDVYSTAEAGLVAIECPHSGQYHLQPEISRAEVLDEQGRSCGPGETGYPVVTSLYNFAMPMIRYRFADLVTCGFSCGCGRGLPVLSRILGRASGLFLGPDGRLFEPRLSTRVIHQLTGAREWQLVQVAATEAILRLKKEQLLEEGQAIAVANYVDNALEFNMQVSVETVASLPRSKGGKFHAFHRTFQESIRA